MLSFLAPNLRSRLVLLVLLAVLPSLGLAFYTGIEEHQIELNQMEVNTLRLTRLAAGNLEQAIEGGRQLLTGLSQLPDVRECNSYKCDELFANLLKQYPYYVNLGMIDYTGTIISSGLRSDVTTNMANQAFIRRALKTHKFVVSGYDVERTTKIPVIYFVYPVFEDNSDYMEGAVFAALNLAKLNRINIAAQLPPGAVLLILDYNGMVLARYPNPEKWLGQIMPGELVILAGMGEGRHSLVALHGGKLSQRLFGITTIHAAPETNIYVSIGMSKEAAFGPVERAFKKNVAGVAVVGILALLAAWIGGDLFILQRVRALVIATRQLASGNLRVRIEPFGDRDELSLLASSFNDMAVSLEERTIQVRQAEAKYRTLVEQIPMVTYIAPLDKTRGMLYISPQIAALSGYSPEEWLTNSNLWVKLLHPKDRDRVLAEVQSGCPNSNKVVFSSEYRIVTRGRTILWFRDEAIAVCNDQNEPEFLQGIMFDITDRKRFEQQLKNSHEKMRELAAHIEAAREEERTRIAREIHDELGQVLTCLKIDLAWMDKKLNNRERNAKAELLKKITVMKDTIDSTVKVVRKISTELRPGILDNFGLAAAIEWLVAEFQSRTQIQCQLSDISEDLDIHLDKLKKSYSGIFRILQELLTNVARHSSASRVNISLRKKKNYLVIEVQDNGRGITKEEIAKANSFGLLGVQERVSLLGGKFQLKSAEGQGTTVTIRIPLDGGSPTPDFCELPQIGEEI